MKRLILLLALIANPATADQFCEDLWFTRNALFDRAGYCFGSALGQALFDNSDCIGKSVSLGGTDKQKADQARAYEKDYGCKVDTSRRTLSIDDLAIRLQLRDQPLRDDLESGCIGWRGTTLGLRSGHSANAPLVGRVEPGDHVLFSHWPVGRWSYVTAHRPGGGFKSAGWVRQEAFPESACDAWAG